MWFDDFEGDQVKDEWRSTGDVGGSAGVVDGVAGGIFRITTGAVINDDWQLDWGDIRSLLAAKRVTMETRFRLNQIVLTAPLIGLRFDNLNYIRFEFNPTTSANWYIRNRSAGAGIAADTGVAADTDWHVFRHDCVSAGEVHYFIDGVETANSPITTNIPVTYLQPYVQVFTFENVAKSTDMDYVYLRQDR
jgi:hypothetical protein